MLDSVSDVTSPELELCAEEDSLNKHNMIDISGVPSSSRESDLDVMRRKLADLQKENISLKEKMEEQKKKEELLKGMVSQLEDEKRTSNITFAEKVKLTFKDVLTANQVDIALKKKKKARWTQDELSKGFTLRYFSKRAYVYMRQTLKYPLPGLSTLQQWAANINLTSGILNDVLRVMNVTGQTKSQKFKVAVLSFDEIKVSSVYEYNQKEDEVMGPNTYMQVVMARGLFEKWKQPVYIGFDQKMTKDILTTIITKLHEIQYCVLACTSDCGGGNQGLWKEMGISEEKTYVKHPVSEKPIYFFGDVPHLLKLLRNWFLDTGFLLNDGTVINKFPVKSLIEDTRTEISSCYKLTPLHITCERTERQNVRLAAQLFSNTTATALKQYLPGPDKTTAAKTADFIQLVNNWFDIFNSYTPSASIPTKKPYGVNLETQDEILNAMLHTIKTMRCRGKNNLQVFQKAIIMSIKSLQGLYASVVEDYDVKYILTHRLNQDCLENFFCQVSAYLKCPKKKLIHILLQKNREF